MKNNLLMILCLCGILFSQAPVPLVPESRLVDWSIVGTLPTNATEACTVLNVIDYGAVPDNAVDDFPAIQNAINDAKLISGMSIIYFPQGTYRIMNSIVLDVIESNGSVTFEGNIVFLGAGENTILEFDLNFDDSPPFLFKGKKKGICKCCWKYFKRIEQSNGKRPKYNCRRW